MNIAYVQFAPSYLDAAANRAAAERLIDGVDADLIVLPELFTSGYFFRSTEDLAAVAETVPEGPSVQHMLRWASASGAVIVGGLPEQEGGAYYNSAVVATPDGRVETYRKVHLYYKEKIFFAPGEQGLPVYTMADRNGESYRLGVMICFDWYFPEAARSLALQGADIIAHPSNLVRPDCPRAMPIRALENHVFTITANRYGTETDGSEALTFIGQSEICDPDGQILVRADRTGEHVGIASIDPAAARARALTAHNHVLADRRPSQYHLHG